jgi:hypothetical protein
MERINLIAAWIGILCGFVAGAVPGLLFHRADWLGGYTSWPRRMIRLAHISFFGLAFINLALVLTVFYLHLGGTLVAWSSRLFVIGAIAMPSICYLSAYKQSFRHLFFIPVLCLFTGTVLLCYGGFLR